MDYQRINPDPGAHWAVYSGFPFAIISLGFLMFWSIFNYSCSLMFLVVIADWMGFIALGSMFLLMIYQIFPGLLTSLQGTAKFVFETAVFTIAVFVVDSSLSDMIKQKGCQVPKGFIIDNTKKLITSSFGAK